MIEAIGEVSQSNGRVNVDNQLDDARLTAQKLQAEINRSVEIGADDLRATLGGVAMGKPILFEGDPSTGKTLTATALATAMGGEFGRVQGTADTMPSDITGSMIWNPKNQEFEFSPGPLFSNVFFADEINRMSPKSQAGLLQAFQERQVTPTGSTETYPLPKPFVAMATQNPNEEGQGTYPLPKASIDRFGIGIHYEEDPAREAAILNRDLAENPHQAEQKVDLADIVVLQSALGNIAISSDIKSAILKLTHEVAADNSVNVVRSQLSGARKNAQIARLAQFNALSDKRENVEDKDVAFAAPYVLGHRIELSYEALENGLTARQVVAETANRILG